MGRKKKAENEKKTPTKRLVRFVGGPKDGEEMNVSFYALKFFRSPLPEWATYELIGDSVYEYRGNKRIIHETLFDEGVLDETDSSSSDSI
jgi:hypothetical protein